MVLAVGIGVTRTHQRREKRALVGSDGAWPATVVMMESGLRLSAGPGVAACALARYCFATFFM
jgi:hypothetical protein